MRDQKLSTDYSRPRIPLYVEQTFRDTMMPGDPFARAIPSKQVQAMCIQTYLVRKERLPAAFLTKLVDEFRCSGDQCVQFNVLSEDLDLPDLMVFRENIKAFAMFMAFLAVTVQWPWLTAEQSYAAFDSFEDKLRDKNPDAADMLLQFRAHWHDRSMDPEPLPAWGTTKKRGAERVEAP